MQPAQINVKRFFDGCKEDSEVFSSAFSPRGDNFTFEKGIKALENNKKKKKIGELL